MNRKYFFAGLICTVLSILCLLIAFGDRYIWETDGRQTESKIANVSIETSSASAGSAMESGILEEENREDVSEPVYESPIDFSSLQEKNPDIYAWLYIPGTEIDYPVVQHPEDDNYYLRRDLEGIYSSEGTLFTEKTYNSTDFADPATIIYGHQMQSGTMFGKLQETYSVYESFLEHQEIIVYMPEEEKHYTVFASVPYDKWHILYNYDFSKPEVFQAFLDKIYATRSLNAVFSDRITVSTDDKLLILSTCLKGNPNNRYLVLAVLRD